MNNYQPRAPHPGRTAVEPCHTTVHATSCNTQSTPGEGMWGQCDFGDGPRVAGTATVLFCFWLAWCRFRVVLPLLDKTLPSVHAAVDVALRRVGGVPTYLLTDNEKTVTVEHIAGLPVRHPAMCSTVTVFSLSVSR